MNELLASRYAESVHRLAAGIEPIDALRGIPDRTTARLSLEYPRGVAAAQPLGHAGGRWSIRYVRGLPDHVDLRIEDPSRCFVPRRLRLPIASLETVRQAELDGSPVPAAERVWRPALFPGAAYPLAPSATAVRGQARYKLAPSEPVRWARIEAMRDDTDEVLWRAHGDDRGEFLLVIGPDPHASALLPAVMSVTIRVLAAKPAPGPPPDEPADPLWDLPLTVAQPGPGDPVSSGVTLPPGFEPGGFLASRVIDLVPGRMHAPAPFYLD